MASTQTAPFLSLLTCVTIPFLFLPCVASYCLIPCLDGCAYPVNPIPYGHCPSLPCMYFPCPSWTVLDAPKAGILAQNGYFVSY